jgi:amidase
VTPRPARVAAAEERWQSISFTRALRALDSDRTAAEFSAAPAGPLNGTLFSVKDLFDVGGVESCAGSLLLAGRVPTIDPPPIRALRAAGATVFGKGVCAEFAFGVDTENRLDGRVLHYEDPNISPGGSSGGDAVAVGAGVVDFAYAGDYGGSIRWPAQACSVFGLRLGSGRIAEPGRAVPTSGQGLELESAGLLARELPMLRAALRVLLGPPPARPRTKRLLTLSGTDIGPVLPVVSAQLEAAGRAAVAAGYELVPVDGLLRDAAKVYARIRALTDDQAGLRELVRGHETLLCDSTRAVLGSAALPGLDPEQLREVTGLRQQADAIRDRVRAALVGADALLLPLAGSPPIPFGGHIEISNQSLDTTKLMAHCRAVSLTGLPALSVPFYADESPRVSVQLVGPDGGEDLICEIAGDLLGVDRGRAAS